MKINKLIIAGAIFISIASYAQKDELKTLKKIYSKETPSPDDVKEFKEILVKLEPLAKEEADKVYLNYYKAVSPQIEMASLGTNVAPSFAQMQKFFSPKAIADITSGYLATLDYEAKTGKKVFTDDINEDIPVINNVLVNVAISLGKAKKDKEASDVLYSAYQLNKKDQEKLFYAASYAVNGKDFDSALKYYQELKALNYSGEGTLYYATNKTGGAEESFATKNQRDIFIKAGTHEKPREEKISSKRGEIYRNIALILVDKGRTEEAKTAYADAIKANPNDNSLLINEANLYLTLKEYDTYTRLVNEALAKEPNNPVLYFNLGVVSGESNKVDIAEGYYKKAIEIDPNYFNAYLNLAEIKMRSDQKYVDEINKLGTSDKDLKRYEVLKIDRNKNFMLILPILEKAVELKPENEDAKKTLLSVYRALEMTDKAKELKAKM